jgi:Uma2 family endonuclease
MAALTHLMTVEEFRKLPKGAGGVSYELHHGELVTVTRPKLKHSLIQHNTRDLFKTLAEPGGWVLFEMAFRPLPEHELWTADVGYLSRERREQADPEDNIRGAPDIVVEFLSPSNTAAELYDREQICLANGTKEFWVADSDRRQVKVTTPDGRTVTWRSGQEIPLPLFGSGARIKVDDIFRY